MPKLYVVMALLGLLGLGRPAAAQTLPSPGPRTCGTPQAAAWQQAQLKRQQPSYRAVLAAGRSGALPRGIAAVTYTLPVVVHIVYDGEAVGTGTNISQAQVQSQLEVLNEDYRNRNADGALVPGAFQGLRGDAQFQFRLAGIDPSGRPLAEPGIDRVNRQAQGWAAPPYGYTAGSFDPTYIEQVIKPQTSWNPEQYVNVWVLSVGGNLLGYAQLPDNTAGLGGLYPQGGLAATDGVVVRYSAFGRTGSLATNYDKGRTLTHEMGHFLGLRHTWGDADCGDDYVADTPTQQTSNLGCPTFPHVTCSNGPSGDLFMDFMDYVNDACMQLFSAGQADRMQAVLAAGTPRRSSLPTSPALCQPLAVAATNSGPVCPGATVRLSTGAVAGATYTWSGPAGFASTAQNPVITNATTAESGVYTVIVQPPGGDACPGIGSTTVVINVAPPPPMLTASASLVCPGEAVTLAATTQVASTLPSETFDSGAPGWTITSAGSAGTAWAYRAAPYSYSSNYVALSQYSLDGTPFALANSDAGGAGSTTRTALVSPAFSTMGYASLQVTFLQHLRYLAGDSATLEASTDGRTWAPVASYASDQGTDAIPATTTVSLNGYAGQASVQLRWRYAAAWSYYWALDNVRFSGTTAAPTYAWSLVSGDGLPATTTTPAIVVTPTKPSVYQLTLGYAGGTCTTSATVSVGLNAAVAAVAATNSGSVCAGASVRLSAGTVAGATYTWSGPAGFASTQQNPIITNTTINNSGTYTVVTAVPGSGLCPATASTQVVVSPVPPVPQLVASAASVCPGSPAVLRAGNLGSGGPYAYAWSLVSGDGLPAATDTPTLTVQPSVASVYQLTLSYPGQGCPTTATVAVAVSPPVWTGAAGDGDWFNAANWLGCVPTRTTDATIPGGLATPYPTIGGGAAEVRTLVLGQPGSLGLSGGQLNLYGDFTGGGTFNQTGGQVLTQGTGLQTLRGDAYLDLAIAGTGPKAIGSSTIGQRLLLGGAVLSTGSATVTLAPAASLVGETDASYVLGQLATTRTLGVGTDALGGLGATLTTTFAPGATTVRRVTGQPQGTGAGQSIGRYYDIAAATGRSQQGATLALAYLPHELNSLPESTLVLFRSTTGTTWTNEGATTRDAAAGVVARAYVTDLSGRWTLASAAAPLPAAAVAYAIQAFPVPFTAAGLSLQVTTPTAGPLFVQVYDVLGRRLYDHAVASVEVGTSTVELPGSGQLAPAKYVVVVQQAGQMVRLSVVRSD